MNPNVCCLKIYVHWKPKITKKRQEKGGETGKNKTNIRAKLAFEIFLLLLCEKGELLKFKETKIKEKKSHQISFYTPVF